MASHPVKRRKKLIEVAIPLEAINAASAREKSIRHGHPSTLPEGSRTPGTVAFHRAVTDYFQKSYAGMGGQLSVVFAAGRIEVAWEPATPEPAGPGAPLRG